MCLIIQVHLPGIPPSEAGGLTRRAADAGVLELRAQRRPKGASGSIYLVGERGQGCACSLLSENADWDQPYYALDPELMPSLEATIKWLATAAGPDGFVVHAAWLDGSHEQAFDRPARRTKLSELLTDVANARILNNVPLSIIGP